MGFADELQKARKDKNISQEELAELLGVSRQSVSKWERCEGYPVRNCKLLQYGR